MYADINLLLSTPHSENYDYLIILTTCIYTTNRFTSTVKFYHCEIYDLSLFNDDWFNLKSLCIPIVGKFSVLLN